MESTWGNFSQWSKTGAGAGGVSKNAEIVTGFHSRPLQFGYYVRPPKNVQVSDFIFLVQE